MVAKLNDYLRAFFVITGAIAQVIMGGIPNALGWEHTISSRSYDVQTLVVPAGYAFAIWSILFLGCLIFAVVQAFPKMLVDHNLRTVGWLAGMAFWGNAIWELWVPAYGLDLGSLILILWILVPLLSALFILKDRKDNRWFFVPLMMLAGWVSVATFVNISVTAATLDFNPFDLSPQLEAAIVLVAAGVTTLFFIGNLKSIGYTFSTCWGFVGIYAINSIREENQLAILALGFGIAGALLLIVQLLRGKKLRSSVNNSLSAAEG